MPFEACYFDQVSRHSVSWYANASRTEREMILCEDPGSSIDLLSSTPFMLVVMLKGGFYTCEIASFVDVEHDYAILDSIAVS